MRSSIEKEKGHQTMIERKAGNYPGRSKSSATGNLVWTVATATDTSLPIEGQTRETLETIDANLREFGTDRFNIVSAQVFVANMADKPAMDAVWREWIGSDPAHWPQRACLGVDLAGNDLIEVVVTAVR